MGLPIPSKNPYPSEGYGLSWVRVQVRLQTPTGTPLLITKDQVKAKMIQDHPKLFKIMCDINVDALKNLLKDHTNLPFV